LAPQSALTPVGLIGASHFLIFAFDECLQRVDMNMSPTGLLGLDAVEFDHLSQADRVETKTAKLSVEWAKCSN
jgi:hypothetical protein